MFDKLIQDVQSNAIRDADLLSELAGLEEYIAETYTQRCFTELFQNSDDSFSKNVRIFVLGSNLIYINDGKLFDHNDFVSLCKSASSNKKRETSIGYRGIGFKSVVNICSSVIVASGELKCIFDRQRTVALLDKNARVPLIRVPHMLTNAERAEVRSIFETFPGYSTCFVFKGINNLSLDQEIKNLTDEHFLFLRNLNNISIKFEETNEPFLYNIDRCKEHSLPESQLTYSSIKISSLHKGSCQDWSILGNGKSAIAVKNNDSLPTRLSREEALLHAYLPTQCLSGTGARFNANFSTDPSRTRLKYDALTLEAISSIAEIYIYLLKNFSNANTLIHIRSFIDSIIPYSYYKLLELQGNAFCGLLITEIKRKVENAKISLYRIPSLYKDIEHLVSLLPSNIIVFSPIASSYQDTYRFFSDIGIPEVPTNFVELFYQNQSNSIDAKCSPFLIRNLLDEGLSPLQTAALYIFPNIRNVCMRVADYTDMTEQIVPDFINVLSVKLLSPGRAKKFLVEAGFSSILVEKMFPSNKLLANHNKIMHELNKTKDLHCLETESTNLLQTTFLDENLKKRYGIKDWRIAEELIAFHYRSNGYQVIDVSKANKGYDLEVSKDSEKICIEIKKLGKAPLSFSLTQNEFNESIFKGNSYVLALVNSNQNEQIEIMFIPNPYSVLSAFTTKRAKSYEFFVSGFSFTPTVIYE